MDYFDKIIDKLKEAYNHDDILCFFITGSVARNEAYEGNDLDALFITRSGNFHKEYRDGESLLEISGNTLEKYFEGLEKNPMLVYMYLDAKAVFDKEDCLPKLQKKAQEILENYKPNEEEVKAIRKWIESVVDKLRVAQDNGDWLKVGFHVSNVLWKVVEGIYIVNSVPTPASTSALRRISILKVLPDNFEELWQKTLLGNLEQRTDATNKLMEFILDKLQK